MLMISELHWIHRLGWLNLSIVQLLQLSLLRSAQNASNYIVYISKPRFESFDKPHVAVLQSAGFKNALRALLSGYARIKRPKHSPEKMYALNTAMLMAVGMLLPCFFPTFLVISGWVESFLVFSPKAFSVQSY